MRKSAGPDAILPEFLIYLGDKSKMYLDLLISLGLQKSIVIDAKVK